MKAVNKQTFKQKMMAYKRKPLSLAMYLLVVIATVLTVGALFFPDWLYLSYGYSQY